MLTVAIRQCVMPIPFPRPPQIPLMALRVHYLHTNCPKPIQRLPLMITKRFNSSNSSYKPSTENSSDFVKDSTFITCVLAGIFYIVWRLCEKEERHKKFIEAAGSSNNNEKIYLYVRDRKFHNKETYHRAIIRAAKRNRKKKLMTLLQENPYERSLSDYSEEFICEMLNASMTFTYYYKSFQYLYYRFNYRLRHTDSIRRFDKYMLEINVRLSLKNSTKVSDVSKQEFEKLSYLIASEEEISQSLKLHSQVVPQKTTSCDVCGICS